MARRVLVPPRTKQGGSDATVAGIKRNVCTINLSVAVTRFINAFMGLKSWPFHANSRGIKPRPWTVLVLRSLFTLYSNPSFQTLALFVSSLAVTTAASVTSFALLSVCTSGNSPIVMSQGELVLTTPAAPPGICSISSFFHLFYPLQITRYKNAPLEQQQKSSDFVGRCKQWAKFSVI